MLTFYTSPLQTRDQRLFYLAEVLAVTRAAPVESGAARTSGAAETGLFSDSLNAGR